MPRQLFTIPLAKEGYITLHLQTNYLQSKVSLSIPRENFNCAGKKEGSDLTRATAQERDHSLLNSAGGRRKGG